MTAVKRTSVPPSEERGTNEDRREAQTRNLLAINQELSVLGLRPLQHTGTYQNGEFELVSVDGHTKNRWYVIVRLVAKMPLTGAVGQFNGIFDAKSGKALPQLFFVLIEDGDGELWVVLTRQHRPAMLVASREWWWLNEAPRGFADDGGETTIVDRIVRRLRSLVAPPPTEQENPWTGLSNKVLNEIAPLWLSGLVDITGIETLPLYAEDSGKSTTIVMPHLLRLRSKPGVVVEGDGGLRERVKGTRVMGIRYVRLTDLIVDPTAHDVRDAHTLTALLHTCRSLGRVH